MIKIKDPVSLFVYAFSNIIILLVAISIIFPALLIRMSSGSDLSIIVDPFEFGALAVPLITSNVIFFLVYFIVKNNSNLRTKFKKIIDFDISNKIGLLAVLLIISVYVILSFNETLESEIWPDYSMIVLGQYESWLSSDTLEENLPQYHTKMFFLHSSELLFQNLRIIPFLASISLLFLTYIFTLKITSKPIAGLISVFVLVQSFLFTTFDTTATYANFWILFYLLSIYLIEKSWHTSFISFFVSIFAKPVTLLFLPASLFYIFRSSLTTKQKIMSIIPYVIIGIVIFIAIFIIFPDSELLPDSTLFFHPTKFISGLTIFSYQLRFDLLILMSLVPLNFLLYKKSLAGHKHAQSLQILLAIIILSGPLLTGLLNFLTNPYRLVSFVVFFAISFGYIFGKSSFGNNNLE